MSGAEQAIKCNRCQGGEPGYVCAGCLDKIAAKSNAQRQREYRARKAAETVTEVRGIFAHPDDHAEVKEAAAKIARRRQRAAKRAAP